MNNSAMTLVTVDESKKTRDKLMNLYGKTDDEFKEYISRIAKIFGKALRDFARCKDVNPELLEKALFHFTEGERKATGLKFADRIHSKKQKESWKNNKRLAQKLLPILLKDNRSDDRGFKESLGRALAMKYELEAFDIDRWLAEPKPEMQDDLVKKWSNEQAGDTSSEKKKTQKELVYDAFVDLIKDQLNESNFIRGKAIEDEDHILVGEMGKMRPIISKMTDLNLQQVSNSYSQLENAGKIQKIGPKHSSSQNIYVAVADLDGLVDLNDINLILKSTVSDKFVSEKDPNLDILSILDKQSVGNLDGVLKTLKEQQSVIQRKIDKLEGEKGEVDIKINIISYAIRQLKSDL